MEQRSRARDATSLVAALALTIFALSCDPGPSGGTPSTRTALLPGDYRTFAAWSVDIDLDGDGDLLLNNHGRRGSGLYLNDGTGRLSDHGGVFKDYPGHNGRWLDRHDCDLADVDRNGRTDIYCTSGSHRGTITKTFPYETNELLLQQPDGTFVNRSNVWGVSQPTARGRDVAFVNANGDAYPDLVTTADQRSDGYRSETVVYLNDRGRSFVDIGSAGLRPLGPIRCLEKTDWNGDGYTDLAWCPLAGGVRLFEATRTAGFRDVTTARGAGPITTQTWDVAFADVNGDGAADLVRTNTTSVAIRLWDKVTKRFTDGPTIAQTDAQDVALGRYDADTKLDLYVMNRGCQGCNPENVTDRLYLGNGNGTFRLSERFDAPGVGDFVSTWDPSLSGRIRWVVGHGYGPVWGLIEVIRPRVAG